MNKKAFVTGLVVASVLAAGIASAVLEKDKPVETPAAAADEPTLEFLPSDLVVSAPGELRQLLPLTGSLRPVNQTPVKARVAGEVREVLVREGEAVQAGQVLVRMDSRDYEARVNQARGTLDAARGQLDIALKARDNNQALLDKGFISRNAFDNAQSQYDIARANVDSARAALELTQKALADTVIRAPISGLIASRNVQPGEKVSPDNRLLDVVDLSQLELEAAVPASDIMHVSLGQSVQVRIEGIATPFKGSVARISPTTLPGSRSIVVYIQIDNPEATLRAGMFAQAELTLASRSANLVLPQSAIRNDADATYVYAIEDERLTRKPVTLGLAGSDDHGAAVEITAGLAAGTQVVRTNLGALRTGSRVNIVRTGQEG